MYGGDEVDAVVLDVGAYNARAGYAGEDAPKAVFTSACGVVARTENGDAQSMETDDKPGDHRSRVIHAGCQAVNYRRDGQEVRPAIEDGACNDWELMEAIWHHALQLSVDPKEHAILLSEPTMQSRAGREKMVELMFEKFQPPAMFLARNAVLSSFANGRQTSLNVDMGHGGTVVSAVHDGYVLQKSVVHSPLGGKLLTQCMLQSIQSKGVMVHPAYTFKRTEITPGQFEANPLDLPDTPESFRTFQVDRIVADIKENICRVSDTPFDADANANIPTVECELPDGQVIHVGPARFSIPEVLFQPTMTKSFGSAAQHIMVDEVKSVPASILSSIEMCDVDIRKELYGGILVTGGTSLFPQMRDRLEKDLNEGAPQAAKVKVIVPANPVERRFSVWIGGSILASLGTFHQLWMSKSEYEDHGASLIHRRAP